MEKNGAFNSIRCGKFTSSTISDLCGFDRSGKNPSATYYSRIRKVAAERFFGTKIQGGSNIACDWGNLCEKYVATLIEPDGIIGGYSDIPIESTIDGLENAYAGTPDFLSKDTIWDCKAPFNLENYFNLYGIDNDGLKKEFPAYYWQLLSNKILTGKDKCGLIAFYPNFDDLQAILELNRNDSISFRLEYQDIDNLPCLGEEFKEMNMYQLIFIPPDNDLLFLLSRIQSANIECERLILEKLKRINNGNN